MRIVASLPNLQVLKLRKLACIGNTWETSKEDSLSLPFCWLTDPIWSTGLVKAVTSHNSSAHCFVVDAYVGDPAWNRGNSVTRVNSSSTEVSQTYTTGSSESGKWLHSDPWNVKVLSWMFVWFWYTPLLKKTYLCTSWSLSLCYSGFKFLPIFCNIRIFIALWCWMFVFEWISF